MIISREFASTIEKVPDIFTVTGAVPLKSGDAALASNGRKNAITATTANFRQKKGYANRLCPYECPLFAAQYTATAASVNAAVRPKAASKP